MNILLTATILIALLTFSIGLIPIVRDSSNKLNRSLFALATSVSLWMVANHISNLLWIGEQNLLWANRLVFSFGCLGLTTMVLVFYYLSQARNKKLVASVYTIGTTATLITLTPFLVKSVIPKEPVTEIEFGAITNIFFSWIVACIVLSAVIYVKGVKNARPALKNRLRLVGLSTLLTMFLLTIFNAALPYLI